MHTTTTEQEASDFFDYLLNEKAKIFKQLFPALSIHLEIEANKKSFQRRANQIIIPSRISFTDFLCFVQRDHKYLFQQVFAEKAQVPHCILALRVTLEMFRVLSGDTARVSINTLINYVNTVELLPLTFASVLTVFGITTERNFEERDMKKLKKENMTLRTYFLMDFLKTFQPLILKAMNSI